MVEFQEFRKIPRLTREIVITEKIDGTNGVVYIGEDGEFQVGSRSRWITPEMDNHGFAAWAYAHREELVGLGTGLHFGEWWGPGIQRRYGTAEKRWSLFNVHRWAEDRPACCHVVPTLYQGIFDQREIDQVLLNLAATGSVASPGFMRPEGIIIYHKAANQLFKKTIEKDEEYKGKTAG